MFVYENGVFTAVPCTKKNSYLSIRDFAEGRDGTIYVASTSGVCRVRSGLLVPYSNPYITGETAYALGIDRYGRLWCAMSTGKCAVMQDDRVLAMLDAELFFEDGSVISCLTSDRANNIYLGTNGSALAKVACSGQRKASFPQTAVIQGPLPSLNGRAGYSMPAPPYPAEDHSRSSGRRSSASGSLV